MTDRCTDLKETHSRFKTLQEHTDPTHWRAVMAVQVVNACAGLTLAAFLVLVTKAWRDAND